MVSERKCPSPLRCWLLPKTSHVARIGGRMRLAAHSSVSRRRASWAPGRRRGFQISRAGTVSKPAVRYNMPGRATNPPACCRRLAVGSHGIGAPLCPHQAGGIARLKPTARGVLRRGEEGFRGGAAHVVDAIEDGVQ